MRYWIPVGALRPALENYRKRLLIEKNVIALRYWKDITEIYTKGVFVQLFNPKLVEFFKKNTAPTNEAVAYVKTFLLPEHAWKLDYGLSHNNGQIAVVNEYLNHCQGCMDQIKGRVIVDSEDLRSWNMIFDENTQVLGILTMHSAGGGGGTKAS